MKPEYLDEMILILTKALKLKPEQATVAREALTIAWEDKLAIVWTVDDVIAIGETVMARAPTPEEARSILDNVEGNYDPRKGITRGGIIQAIEDMGIQA